MNERDLPKRCDGHAILRGVDGYRYDIVAHDFGLFGG